MLLAVWAPQMGKSISREDPRVRRALRRRWLRFFGVLAMCLPATQCLRNDEVDCEEAVKRMEDCCPGFNHDAVQCVFNDGCGISYPDLTPGESSCIIGASCNALLGAGVCQRVEQRSAHSNDPEMPEGLAGEICP
jgi:hypothetical protein